MRSRCRCEELEIALTAAMELQAHYAKMLNEWDGGERQTDFTAETWIARLREMRTIPAARPKAELTQSEEARTKLQGLLDAGEYFNSDQTSIIARDNNEKVIGVGVVTVGDDAAALAEWLNRRGIS